MSKSLRSVNILLDSSARHSAIMSLASSFSMDSLSVSRSKVLATKGVASEFNCSSTAGTSAEAKL